MKKIFQISFLILCILTLNILTGCTKKYTVTFKDYDGTLLKEEIVKKGDDAIAPNNPSREGYTFIGWNQNYTDVKKDLVVVAKYEPIIYTITFNTEGGENINPITYKITDSVIDLNDIISIKEGFIFLGWYNEENEKINSIDPTSCKNITLNAKWDEKETLVTTTGLRYELSDDGTYYIVASIGTATDTDVVIPSIYNNLPVTSIRNRAFTDCTSLTSIKIPNSVTSIGELAFDNCINLESIEIPNSITIIGGSAFSGCTSLKYNIYDNAKYLGNKENPYLVLVKAVNENIIKCGINKNTKIICSSGFTGCTLLTSGLEYAFYNCTSLTSIEIPNSVTSIGDYAFYNCTSLTSVVIGDSVTSIGSAAFCGCTNLESIEIPDSVVSIGYSAFYNFTCLENVYYNGTIEDWCKISFSDYDSNPMYYAEHIYMLNENNEYYEVKEIVIPETVTAIGSYQFYGFDNLTNIEIGDSVTSIGSCAFDGCISLKYNIFDNAKYLGNKENPYLALVSTTDKYITKCEINENTKFIMNDAFCGCTKLKSIEIPNSVASIGYGAFSECTSLESIELPNSVTSIGSFAFEYCTSLTSIEIPDSVTSIGGYAFWNCTSIENLYYKGTIEDWCKISFSDYDSNPMYYAEHIYMLNENNEYYEVKEIVIPETVTAIGSYQFYGFDNLTSIEIPNSVTSIGNNAFSGCTNLKYNIYDNAKYLGNIENPYLFLVSAIDKNITKCKINEKTKIIMNNAFIYCESLTNITIPNSVTSIGWNAFDGCTSLTSIEIPNSVTSIGDYAFFGCTSLTSVEIGDSVTSIGEYVFYRCKSLTSVEIGDSVTSIASSAFYNCTNLESIIVDKDNRVYDSRDNCNAIIESDSNALIVGCKNTIIPNSVISIGDFAFQNCTSLTSIYIPDSITSIRYSAFWGCINLESIIVDKNNRVYDSRDNCNAIIETDSNTLILGCKNTIIPNDVTSIGYGAFEDCTSLTSIEIPDSVTSIGGYAFSGCTSLENLYYKGTIEDWCKIEFSGFSSNPKCYSEHIYMLNENNEYYEVKEIVIPETVTAIGSYQFYGFDNLISIEIPNSVTSIGDYAFFGCTSLTSVEIGDSVTSIGEYVFYRCKSLTSVEIGDSVTSIGEYAFCGCTSLTSVQIGDSVTSIGLDAFSGCTSLTSVEIGDSVTSIGLFAFSCCTSLTSIEIGDSVISIGYYAFDGCASLESIEIPNSVISIGSYAFRGCTSLTSVVIGDSVTSIGYGAFSYCTSLTSVVIGDSVTSIGDYAFDECANLESLTIPDSVTSMGDYAFRGCTSLTSVVIGDSVTSIGSYAFSGCTSLTSINISNSVTCIGNYAFHNCVNLKRIDIPKSVKTVESYAFDGCKRLTICCEARSKPNNWNKDWNSSNCPVIWGYVKK